MPSPHSQRTASGRGHRPRRDLSSRHSPGDLAQEGAPICQPRRSRSPSARRPEFHRPLVPTGPGTCLIQPAGLWQWERPSGRISRLPPGSTSTTPRTSRRALPPPRLRLEGFIGATELGFEVNGHLTTPFGNSGGPTRLTLCLGGDRCADTTWDFNIDFEFQTRERRPAGQNDQYRRARPDDEQVEDCPLASRTQTPPKSC